MAKKKAAEGRKSSQDEADSPAATKKRTAKRGSQSGSHQEPKSQREQKKPAAKKSTSRGKTNPNTSKKPAKSAKAKKSQPDSAAAAEGQGIFPIVAIGASAGGLAALKAFFAKVPEKTDLAFVVVVHLSPDHESHLAELLQPHVKMPVQQVTQTVKLERNCVYVIPPGANLDTIDTHLRLTDLEARRRERAPIDHFFRTLAKTHDGDAIGVILTGTGSDGTLGMREIKQVGGFCIVQDPAEAEYDGMPQSAIATGLIDLVLPVAEIPHAILRFAHTRPDLPDLQDGQEPDGDARQILQKVYAQLRARAGRDFTRYKRTTILRRIERRMQLHHVEKLNRYLDLLRNQPDEVRTLADDLLITVTNFFRDPEVFQTLAKEVVPELFEGKGPEEEIRVWSVGCATGEEAYSLAILLLEEADRREDPPRIQVFASDLHERSLKSARDGFYPGDIETDVPPERLQRFFVKEDNGYRVRKEVREVVTFAPHNLLSDPPFSRIDLITCRNLLIYLERDVQQDVIELFHYSLRNEGFLSLGLSESLDSKDLFRVLSKKCCLYRKRNVPAPEPRLPVFPLIARRHAPDEERPDQPGEPIAYGNLHQQLVERYAPPSALVSPDDQVVHLSEHAGRYLIHPGGEPTSNALKIVRPELRIELRVALQSVREQQKPISTKPLPVQFNGQTRPVVLHVSPAREPHQQGFALVIFEEREETRPGPERKEHKKTAAKGADEERVRELESELELTKQRLQALIEEYETSQEEMKASNEEMQSTNEELRSTMEELETSKEELQSMNEELQTVNQENRHKMEELDQLTSDLQNLLTATEIATLFLDRELRILRFTPQLGNLFNVRLTDRGRPISDFTHRLGYSELQEDAGRVLDKLVPVEREVEDEQGNWYLARVLPYRSAEDQILGVVITFLDISARKQSENDLGLAKEYAESIVETLHEPLLVLHPDLTVKTCNPAFYEHFQVNHEETYGRKVYDLGNGQWDIPEFRTLLEDVLPDSNVFNDYEVHHELEDMGHRVMLLNARRLDHVQLILLGIRDITEKKRAEEAIRESEDRYRMLFQAMDEAYAVVEPLPDDEGRWVDFRFLEVNPAFYEHTSMENVVGRTATEILGTPNPRWAKVYGQVVGTGEPLRFEERELTIDRVFSLYAFRLGESGSRRVAVLFTNVTEIRRAEQKLRESEERYRVFVESVQEYAMLMLDADGRITAWNTGAERIFGYRDSEALGKENSITFTEEDRRQGIPEAELETAAREGRASNDRWQLRQDGSRFWASGMTEALYDGQGNVRGFAKVLRDNTRQKQDEEALRQLNETLERRVAARTAELERQNARLQLLAQELTQAEHRERRELGETLHDGLQQVLVAAKMHAVAHNDEAGTLDQVVKLIDDSLNTTRTLSYELNPPRLREAPLPSAIQWLASWFAENHGHTVEIAAAADFPELSEESKVLLYSIVRELLLNSVKHSGVKETEVRLVRGPEGEAVIEVDDEGRGFDPTDVQQDSGGHPGFGLFSVSERLAALGGRLEIEAAPGAGAHFTVRLPT